MLTTDLLARVPLFHEMDRADLEMIASVTREESYDSGQEIMTVGDAGHSLYIVIEGVVVVVYPSRSSDVELARLGAGEFFGEMAILNDKPRSATVRALGAVKVLRLERDAFTRLVMESPRVSLKVMESLSGRIRNSDEQISGLAERSLRDSLTGLLNRRSFHDRLNEECDRSRRYGAAFALVVLDLDHFKEINDTFGHLMGDTVLTWVGRILDEHTRSSDIPFRVGGEEFAVVCPATGLDEAAVAARRLVDLIGSARPPVGFTLNVTVSAGFAVSPIHGKRGEHVFQAADQALLRAKTDGRNRAFGAPVPPS